MSFPNVYLALLSLILLLNAAPVHLSQENEPSEVKDARELAVDMCPNIRDGLMQVLDEQLKAYDSTPFPGLPPFEINIGESVNITFSLANIFIQGLRDIDVSCPVYIQSLTPHLIVTFNKISLYAGTYASAGHIINLPFNGEGPMLIRLHKLSFEFSFQLNVFTQCAKYNSTNYDLRLERMETQFENMNADEAPDLGQLINIVIPSVGQDIVDRFEQLIFTNHYYTIDKVVISIINMIIKCNQKTLDEIVKTEELVEMIKDTFQHMFEL